MGHYAWLGLMFTDAKDNKEFHVTGKAMLHEAFTVAPSMTCLRIASLAGTLLECSL